jgi:hypothetical protein
LLAALVELGDRRVDPVDIAAADDTAVARRGDAWSSV